MKTNRFRLLFLGILFGMIGFNACKKIQNYYAINKNNCTRCRECVPTCAYGAISVDSTYYITDNEDAFEYEYSIVIDEKKCVGCGECFKACDYNAISSKIF